MQPGKLFIVSGPSGVGKKSILEEVMKDASLNLISSVSMTTRKPRYGEVNGVDYFFVTKEEFLANIARNNFLEYATYNENFYGTPKSFVWEQLQDHKNVLMEIETQGVKKLLGCELHPIKIFICPPKFEDLKTRLLKRGTETLAVIEERLERAKQELMLTNMYDYVVVNANLQQTILDVKSIIKNEELK